MLVLKILHQQKIYIDGGAITLTLTDSGYNWAKIGVDAPSSVSIHREGICPQGPTRCCRCGGKLPPPGEDGERALAHTGCRGKADPDTGRCLAFAAEKLCGDAQVGHEREDGAA